MNARTLERLQYFIGRVCTIISASMNRNFDERISREHFVVRVQDITLDGIWGTHPYNDQLVSFFNLTHIISVHEEVELDPKNPEDAEMIREFESKTGKKVKSDIKEPLVKPASEPQDTEAGFIDIRSLEKLADQTRKTMESYDKRHRELLDVE